MERRAAKKRRKQQIDLLPAGTILIRTDNDYYGVAIVNSASGECSERSFEWRSYGHTSRLDLSIDFVSDCFLAAPQTVKLLPPKLLSAHERLTALAQAATLADLVPEFVKPVPVDGEA